LLILAQPRVVAGGAHNIPGHSSPRPMAPFTGTPIFLAIDIEPFGGFCIEREFGRLQPAARRRNQTLAERGDSDNALCSKRSLFTADTGSGKLKFSIRDTRFGALRCMAD